MHRRSAEKGKKGKKKNPLFFISSSTVVAWHCDAPAPNSPLLIQLTFRTPAQPQKSVHESHHCRMLSDRWRKVCLRDCLLLENFFYSLTSKGWPVSMTALCRNFIPRRHKLCWAAAPCDALWSDVVSSYTLETVVSNLSWSREWASSLRLLIYLLINIHTWFGCQLRIS